MNKLILSVTFSLLSVSTALGAAPVDPPAANAAKVAPPPAASAVGNERIQLPATQGIINFPHRLHQEMLKDCSNCHSQTPGKIPNLGKAWAHNTCRGCHNETSKAPIQCVGCHSVKTQSR